MPRLDEARIGHQEHVVGAEFEGQAADFGQSAGSGNHPCGGHEFKAAMGVERLILGVVVCHKHPILWQVGKKRWSREGLNPLA